MKKTRLPWLGLLVLHVDGEGDKIHVDGLMVSKGVDRMALRIGRALIYASLLLRGKQRRQLEHSALPPRQ